jgi:hypothetical protein
VDHIGKNGLKNDRRQSHMPTETPEPLLSGRSMAARKPIDLRTTPPRLPRRKLATRPIRVVTEAAAYAKRTVVSV